ncbi:chromosomal replication initiator protein DnaA [Amycolatopsis eburnea]|uniref:Uncharacterized protein n=1 Tax=Amycolatopsis eburnea TaxID=2267691 RepID=A0A3R9FRJ0_9PSEU|nr:hypothetical protein [Amycolatopsis eburnea]RSD22138.1 hypothetical protein EIY87_10060 [Amycolatopsis eburnea]
MDENYARRLRDWLRAEPETAEPRWLREIPAPAPEEPRDHPRPDTWSVRGQLPQTDDGQLAVVIPLPRPSGENGCRLSGPARRTRRGQANSPTAMSEAEVRSRRNHPSNAGRDDPAGPLSEAEARSRRNHPSNAGRGEPAIPMSEAEADQHRRDQAANSPTPMSEAEARSRWNHPSNWHRRRRAAENPHREDPGSR